jgi:hypothetical protein
MRGYAYFTPYINSVMCIEWQDQESILLPLDQEANALPTEQPVPIVSPTHLELMLWLAARRH